MEYLHWVPELDTGIAEIDTQHRRIVDYINKLRDLRESHDRQGLSDVIAEMVDYTMSHFAFEEALIENAGYMFSGPHKKVHELFTRKVAEIQTRFEAGEDVEITLHFEDGTSLTWEAPARTYSGAGEAYMGDGDEEATEEP